MTATVYDRMRRENERLKAQITLMCIAHALAVIACMGLIFHLATR